MIFEAQLPSVARTLRDQIKGASATFFWDVMSGAVIWSDEKVSGLTADQLGCLRSLFRCRTNRILAEPEQRFDGVWEAFQEACPNWIGFSPERNEPNEELVTIIRKLKRKAKKEIDLLFRSTGKS